MGSAGRIGLSGLLWLAFIAACIYAAVLYVPLWVDNLDVREAVGAAFNLSGRNLNDALLRQEIKRRTWQTGTHTEKDEVGRDVVVPGLGLSDDDISIERSAVTDSIRIEVDYDREMQVGLLSRTWPVHFRVVKEGFPPR